MLSSPVKGQTQLPKDTKNAFITAPDSIQIHYLEAGPREPATRDQPPSLLFIPGWTMPGWVWEEQIAHFSEKYRVVAMDPRSQGDSTLAATGNSPDGRAPDIAAVIEQLHLAPVVLIGWSQGVADILAYIKRYGSGSMAGFVCADGFVGFRLDLHFLSGGTSFVADVAKHPPLNRRALVRAQFKKRHDKAYIDSLVAASEKTPTATATQMLMALLATKEKSSIAKIDKPTLIIVPSSSALAGPEKTLQRKVRSSKLIVLHGVGHAVFADDPVTFDTLLQQFLDSLASAGPLAFP